MVQTILHTGLRFEQAETVDETLPNLLGHSARLCATMFKTIALFGSKQIKTIFVYMGVLDFAGMIAL